MHCVEGASSDKEQLYTTLIHLTAQDIDLILKYDTNLASDTGAKASIYHLLIIGGRINGCVIARDAAGCGYSVMLAEQSDLAQGTSSGSTNVIHGGLRFLEHYGVRLVRESPKEQQALW